MQLGDKIKNARTTRGLTIKTVTEEAGITRSLLSQIENNKTNPSINTLMAIAKALGVPIGSFFDPEPVNSDPIVHADDRKMLKTQSGVTFFLLTPQLSGHTIEFMYNVYDAGGSTGNLYSHEGEECGIVLEGELEITYNGQTYRMKAGDSIVLNSRVPHSIRNVHEGKTIAIWANSPPSW